jgi:hypothetical protein
MRWLGHPIESPKLPYTGHHWTRRGKGKSGRLRTTLRRKITSELEEMGFSMGQAQYITKDKKVLTDDQLFELLGLDKLRKTENLLKHLIRKGEECCKYLLQSFESESIQKTFILYDILGFKGLLFFVCLNIRTLSIYNSPLLSV